MDLIKSVQEEKAHHVCFASALLGEAENGDHAGIIGILVLFTSIYWTVIPGQSFQFADYCFCPFRLLPSLNWKSHVTDWWRRLVGGVITLTFRTDEREDGAGTLQIDGALILWLEEQ